MGCWEQDEKGHSFEAMTDDPAKQLMWGATPTDFIDGALHAVRVAFMKDLGRLPSKAEIIAGIKFSTNAINDLPERPEDAVPLTPEQQLIVDAHGATAMGWDVSTYTPTKVVAIKKIRSLLKDLAPKRRGGDPA